MIIGVGCDIVELDRIRQLMKKAGCLRILTQEERCLYENISEVRKAEWLAGRFAAKEAIIKAISAKTEKLLSEISVGYDGNRPVCTLPGIRIHISISHERHTAIAYAVAEEDVSCM